MNLEEAVAQQGHLMSAQQKELLQVLQGHCALFGSGLGQFKKYESKIKLKENAVPKAARVYPVPRLHLQAFKQWLQQLLDVGVMEKSFMIWMDFRKFYCPKEGYKCLVGSWLITLESHYLSWSLSYSVYSRIITKGERNEVCFILQKAGFKVNPNKYEWVKQEVAFLGHLLTTIGIKPLSNKIQTILNMKSTIV